MGFVVVVDIVHRKVEKTKREGQRRSPRISALDAWKMAPRSRPVDITLPCKQEMEGNFRGPASRTRSRKKPKLRPVEEVGGRKTNHGDHQTDTDQQVLQDKGQLSIPSSATWMPEKRILDLILDILQRRDTYEIFAEPVDPQEVEDYYEIIKEPMDFGTMRAKLHEGIYKNLEQFEHDVFLISKNAMHFNSSTTIYFRQARALNELTNKVLQVLKTHPENFEIEFSEMRRRSRRRLQTESNNSLSSTSPQNATKVKSSSIMIKESSNLVPRSFGSSSSTRRQFRVKHGCSDFSSGIDRGEEEILSGSIDVRCRSFEANQRYAYKPRLSFLNEDESIVSTVLSSSKQLEFVSQPDIGYRESLMLFVKDLGPTALMIAKRKLLGLFKGQFSTACTGIQWGHSILDTMNITSKSQICLDHVAEHHTVTRNTIHRTDSSDADEGEKAYMGRKIGLSDAMVQVQSGSEKNKAHDTIGEKVHTMNVMTIPGVCGSEKVHPNQSNGIQLSTFSLFAHAAVFNSSIAGYKSTDNMSTMILDPSKLDDQSRSLESPSEHSHSNLSGPKLKLHDLSSFYHDNGVNPSSEGSQTLTSDQWKSPTPKFIFDLPYLRARLDQKISSEHDSFLKQDSGMEIPFFNKMSNPRASFLTHGVELNAQPYGDDQLQSSLDIHHRNLALQL
ncbi:uncharacterized protein LOC107431380 isoform X1 [Ziziphus jujuba]|uniref:Uncharacterized protein LOC107431380 isoform X1 n=1 Tax=Ziziphus jujuba TaxID=326968 RepID=A0A6P6GLB6_ZIZJJ|nr:uncharacterized protein LOC107431380 isoform X1 [Ziziphus jujuba]